MQFAGRLMQSYANMPLWQQRALETALTTGGLTGVQAVTTDLSPEELAISAMLQAGLSGVGRPIANRAGAGIGRLADDTIINDFKKRGLNATGEEMRAILGDKVSSDVRNKLGGGPMGPVADQLVERMGGGGGNERIGRLIGEQFGDNALQVGAAVAFPQLVPTQAADPAAEQSNGYGAQHITAVKAMLNAGQITEEQARAMLD